MRLWPGLLVVAAVGCAFELPEPKGEAAPADPDAGDVAPEKEAGVAGATDAASEAAAEDAGPAGTGGIALVQKIGGGFAKVETVTHAFAKPVTPGNAIIVFAYTQGTRDVTLTDTDGNAYQALDAGNYGLSGSARFFLAPVAKASATPASLTMSIVTAVNIGFVALEYAGLLRDTDLDEFVEDNGYTSTTSTLAQTDPMKTTAKQSLALAAFWYSRAEGVIAPDPAWQTVSSDPGYFFLVESRVVGPGSVTGTATMPMSYEWGSVFAAFAGR